MKTIKKITILILTIVVALMGLIYLMYYKKSPLFVRESIFINSKKHVEMILDINYEKFTYLSNYMMDIESDSIRWDSIDRDKFTFYYEDSGNVFAETFSINDDSFATTIDHIEKGNLFHILKESNYIMFVVSVSLNSSYGLVYCEQYPEIKYNGEVHIEQLEKNNWYYYESISD